MPITTKILEYKVQVQCYGVPPTQLAVSFISHEYHYVGMTSVIVVMGLPQSDQIYTVDCKLLDTRSSASKVTWTNQNHADIINLKSDWSM